MRRALAIGGVCLLATGCGSVSHRSAPPKLPRAVADRLAAESDGVAAALATGDACRAKRLAARLLADARTELPRMPPRFRRPLTSGVAAVVAAVPACTPAAPVTPAPAPHPRGHPKHEHGNHGHGHHGHGHHGGGHHGRGEG